MSDVLEHELRELNIVYQGLASKNQELLQRLDYIENIITDKKNDFLKLSDKEKLAYRFTDLGR